MICAVTGPTVPRIGAANSLVIPRGIWSAIASTPLMSVACCPTAGGTWSWRKAIACTNAFGPAALTCRTYGATAMPTRRARRRAESAARAAGTLSRSTPNRTTGRSVTSPIPWGPRMSPRWADSVVTCSVSPDFRAGSTTAGLQTTSHVDPEGFSVAVLE